MSDDTAQIYLATPKNIILPTFTEGLARVLDTTPVACVRIALASTDALELGRAADQLRVVCHARDVAIVMDDHYRLVQPHGLDGVHLTSGATHIRDARAELGTDAIIGAYCGTSRHAGMTAAEIGTDYISFGPISDTALGDSSVADTALFQWWSEMIEVPVVAEGSVTLDGISKVKDYIDFLTLGDEIWGADEGALQAISAFTNALKS